MRTPPHGAPRRRASALLEDGYFSASTDYNQIPWYDEFDLAGTASTKWLADRDGLLLVRE